MSIGRGAAAVVVIASVVLVLAGCGDIVAGLQEPSPGQTAPGSSPASQAKDVSAYLDQVRPTMSRLRATVSSLSGAAKDMSAEPDATWATTAERLDGVAAELAKEADSLDAVTPPESLRSVHESAVDAIRRARVLVTQTAGLLDKGAALSGTDNPLLEALVAALKLQVPKLSQQLLEATQGLEPSGGPAAGS